MIKKIKIVNKTSWSTHFIGWRPALDELIKLHNHQGVLFIGYLDDIASFTEIKEPFVGFFHHVPINPPNIGLADWSRKWKGLESYFDSPIWATNRKKCKGLFTLCNYTRDYIVSKTGCKASSLLYPFPDQKTLFSFDLFLNNKEKILFHPGNWSRNFEFINQIDSPYPKVITGKWLFQNPNSTIKSMGFVSNEVYDSILNCNIVLQNYFDVAASNTILECIAKNTPLFLNRLPAAEEYLGINYPLFYSSLAEAESMVRDVGLIYQGHIYLKNMDKSKYTLNYFLTSFYDSIVYKQLNQPTLM